MSIAEAPTPAPLLARVRGILFKPTAEWGVIKAEVTTLPELFIGYACILMAIPSIAVLLQLFLFSHLSLLPAFAIAVVDYILSLLGFVVQGCIFNALAPSFGGQRSFVQAMKLAIYPQTAACLASVVNILPFLGIVVLVAGLYGLYTLWLGLPRLMKVPPDKAVGYVVVNLILAFVVNAALATLIFRATLVALGTRAVWVGTITS